MLASGVNRSSTVAWCGSAEHASLLAAGTVAGAYSESFDTTAHLEIFSLVLGSSSSEMPCLGSIQTSERFHRLAWGTMGVADGSRPYGILAGGMVDGTIKIFNPALMIGRATPPPSPDRAAARRATAAHRRRAWPRHARPRRLPDARAPRCWGSALLPPPSARLAGPEKQTPARRFPAQ